MFTPEDYLIAPLDGANSTRLPTIPEHECVGFVKDVKPRFVTTKNGEQLVFDVLWGLDSDIAKQATNLPEPIVKQTLWIDRTEQGTIDMREGKNVSLGRLRQALKVNTAGFKPADLVGKTARVKVGQVVSKKDANDIFNEISNVTAL